MRIGFGDALYEAAGGQSPLPQAGEGLGVRAVTGALRCCSSTPAIWARWSTAPGAN
jgi:hypothetical protein